jgi:hypothetical protein
VPGIFKFNVYLNSNANAVALIEMEHIEVSSFEKTSEDELSTVNQYLISKGIYHNDLLVVPNSRAAMEDSPKLIPNFGNLLHGTDGKLW